MQNLEPWALWIIQTGAVGLQAFLAYLAQSQPKYAWLMPVVSFAQSTMPSPIKSKPANGK